MRLIKMTGGLGNQMFIYAMYMKMRTMYPDTRIDLSDMMHYKVHCGYELHKVFDLPYKEFCINQTVKKVLEFLFFKTVLERKQGGSLEPYRRAYLWPLVYFKGFYQSERYFAGLEADVRRVFTFSPDKANNQSRQMIRQMQADVRAVSLHVRRGDYLQEKHWESLGSICQRSYYVNAMEEMERHVAAPHYYVFSEDLEWVKKNLLLSDAVYIDWNTGADSWQDMMLMSCCHHHIICNSTFGWWGAWLNPAADKVVVAPELWTRTVESCEVVPDSWLKVAVG